MSHNPLNEPINVITVGIDNLANDAVMTSIRHSMGEKTEILIVCINEELQRQDVEKTGILDEYKDRVTIVNESLIDSTSLIRLKKSNFLTETIKPDKKYTNKNTSKKKQKRKRNKKTHNKK